jgi:hypothetical protein
LDRQLGPVSFSGSTVTEIVDQLIHKYHVPISFLESDHAANFSLDLPASTVGQILDQVVTKSGDYQYRFFDTHLVLYSKDPKWATVVKDLNLARRPRRWISESLVYKLRRKVQALEKLMPPWTFGNPSNFVYTDEVAVTGPASVVELFVQILGNRPSAVFTVTRDVKRTAWFRLDAADIVDFVKISAPTLLLREKGQQVKLSVVGVLHGGTRQDVTSGKCFTSYVVSNSQVVIVEADGLVTAVGEGETQVTAINETAVDSVTITVRLRKPKIPAAPGSAGTLARAGKRFKA